MLHKITALLIVFFSTLLLSQAQQKGKISGKVEDAATSEELIGVAVGIKGSSFGANTDIEGNYLLTLDPGTYTVVVSYVGYKTKEITEVIVKAGEVTSLHISMEESVLETEEVVITAEFKKESVDALMLERKNAVSVSDGTSADLIKKSPDRNTSDVLKRVSGAAIQDNKFAVIRGLNERYNIAMLNGTPMPSSEPDRKAFALDIFPSNMVESMNIIKTATPDLPGDFAGGVIKLKTKDIPDENFFRLSVGLRGNSITTTQNFTQYNGGKYDWLGVDDGTRKLSSEFPNSQQLAPKDVPTFSGIPNNGVDDNTDKEDQQRDFDGNYRTFLSESGKKMSSNWGTSTRSALPAATLQLSAGHRWHNLGNLFSLSYTRNIRHSHLQRKDYNASNVVEYDYSDNRYNDDVLLGGMWNISYKLSENHKLSLKNTYNINSSDQTILRTGSEIQPANTLVKVNVYNFTQNRLNTHQLSGDHFIPGLNKTKIDWTVGYSFIRRLIPDYRNLKYQKSAEDLNSPFLVPMSEEVQPLIAGRFFSDMKENVKSAGLDFTEPLPTLGFIKTELKFGGYLQERDRKFTARQFGVTKNIAFKDKSPQDQDSLLSLPENEIFNKKNLDYTYTPRNPKDSLIENDQGELVHIDKTTGLPITVVPFHQGTFDIKENVNLTNTYTAASTLKAAYFMFDNRFGTKIRVAWGFRLESFNQRLNSYEPGNNNPNTATKIALNTTKNDWLPSVNVTYSPLSRGNVRFSYYRTVNRPEFRELAPFRFFDFVDNFMVEGNANVKRALIDNVDLRLEFFPGAGQVLSVTGFYKKFQNPVERVLIEGTSTRIINYINAPTATNYGLEFDLRQNLQFLSPTSNFVKRFTLSGNYSRIWSEVDFKDLNLGLAESKRPLQGQSSFLINGGLTYTDEDHGFGLSLLANRVGRRIAYVGTANYETIWENPRTILDFQVSKELFKNKLEFRFNLSDILAQKQIFYQDQDKSKNYSSEKDNTMFAYNWGRNWSFTLAYKF